MPAITFHVLSDFFEIKTVSFWSPFSQMLSLNIDYRSFSKIVLIHIHCFDIPGCKTLKYRLNAEIFGVKSFSNGKNPFSSINKTTKPELKSFRGEHAVAIIRFYMWREKVLYNPVSPLFTCVLSREFTSISKGNLFKFNERKVLDAASWIHNRIILSHLNHSKNYSAHQFSISLIYVFLDW